MDASLLSRPLTGGNSVGLASFFSLVGSAGIACLFVFLLAFVGFVRASVVLGSVSGDSFRRLETRSGSWLGFDIFSYCFDSRNDPVFKSGYSSLL